MVRETDRLDMTSAVYSGRKANKILHFLKAICSDVRAFRCSSFDVYKKTTDLNWMFPHYHLDESTFIFRDFLGASGVIFHVISFSSKNHISKQNSPRWDAAKRGVTSGAIMFAFVPQRTPGVYGLILTS